MSGADPARRHGVGEDVVAPVVAGEGVAQRVEGAPCWPRRSRAAASRPDARPGSRGGSGCRPRRARPKNARTARVASSAGASRLSCSVRCQTGAPGLGPGVVVRKSRLGLVGRRVVDQHVDAALPGERLLPRALRGASSSVRSAPHQVAALGRRFGQRLGRLPPRVVVDDDGGAAIEQRAHATRADAARDAPVTSTTLPSTPTVCAAA